MAIERKQFSLPRRLLRNSLILIVIGIVAVVHGLVVGNPDATNGEMPPQFALGIWFIIFGGVLGLISWFVLKKKAKTEGPKE
ncbi:LPXTG cell wall anchor domain-containing protein [Ewingella sp. AOP9-I1-14]